MCIGRITKALEEKFPEVVSERPDLLAYHHAAAEQKREAIGYAQKAAQGALVRSGYAEAIAHVRGALGWLDGIDDAQACAETELALNGVILPALMATQSYASPELEGYNDALSGDQRCPGGQPYLLPTLWALVTYHHVRGHRAQARDLGHRLVALAEQSGDAGQIAAALVPLGQCLYTEGRFREAAEILERSIALYRSGQAPQPRIHLWARYQGICLHEPQHGARLDGIPGASDGTGRARHVMGARAQPRQQHRPCVLLPLRAPTCTGASARGAAELLDELIVFADRHGLSFNKSFGLLLRNAARREFQQSRQILAECKASGQVAGYSYQLALVAESAASFGEYREALQAAAHRRALPLRLDRLQSVEDQLHPLAG